tara:strand:+ start:5736 stop:6377 length:642 start_codon:yes stop_codon:yes gene_type:complete
MKLKELRVKLGEKKDYTTQQIKQAYGILNDPRYKGGNYSGAVAAIEKIAKGLASHPDVANALRRANEETQKEDAPANAVGDGSNVALPPSHEPGIDPKKKKKEGEKSKFSTFLTRYQKESYSEKELVLQTSNDEKLYRMQIQPIILNLARKKAKGVYDKNLAVKLFRYAVDNKVKELAGPSSRTVPGTTRDKVAGKLLSIFDGEIEDKVKDLK